MRVRRETVLSLAKIGGEDAAQLVVEMLNDSYADVRTAAARAVSVLKAERAFKPLLGILQIGGDDSVIEQVLRALGQLGDPAAVPLIEKRAVGSLLLQALSRGPCGRALGPRLHRHSPRHERRRGRQGRQGPRRSGGGSTDSRRQVGSDLTRLAETLW